MHPKAIPARAPVDVPWLLSFWTVFTLSLVASSFCGWSIVSGASIGHFVCSARDSFKETKAWACEGSIGRVWKDGKMLPDDTSYSEKIVNKAGSKSYVQEMEEWMDHNP